MNAFDIIYCITSNGDISYIYTDSPKCHWALEWRLADAEEIKTDKEGIMGPYLWEWNRVNPDVDKIWVVPLEMIGNIVHIVSVHL